MDSSFRSEQRDAAQNLCGWTFDINSKDCFQTFVESLCSRQEFTRAALIACFQLKIRYAIEILGMGAERVITYHFSFLLCLYIVDLIIFYPQPQESNNLRMAAIALSGFSFEKNAIWRSQCVITHSQISDPYLRAMFAFLTPDNDSYESVLVSIFFLNSNFNIKLSLFCHVAIE